MAQAPRGVGVKPTPKPTIETVKTTKGGVYTGNKGKK